MPPKIVSKDTTYVSPLLQLQSKNGQPAKRIRVARACDTCRKRKVKCDGKQPCIHCTVYSYECTYNHFRPPQPSQKKQKKDDGSVLTGSGSFTLTPSQRLHQAQQQTHQLQPPQQTQMAAPLQKRNGNGLKQVELLRQLFPEVDMLAESFNADLFVMLFEKHKQGGIVDMKAILEEYKAQGNGVVAIPPQQTRSMSSSVTDAVEIRIILPPREIALKLIYKTWNDSCVLFRFYHRPSFIRDFNSLYETNPAEYSNHQNKMLPLIYSVIAVGALFSKGDNAIDNQYLQDEGYKYFIAARKLIDITNSTDLESIQTIFMLTLFLQCSARLSTCYSYIGIALRSALRQGLHRKLETKCNNIKAECKKRLFWTIYKLEIYVNSMLGLPNSIDEEDVDAEFPQDLDDANIDLDKLTPQIPGKLSSCGINNSHTRLILILNHIMKKLYKTSNPIYTIPMEVVRNLENELKVWLYELPFQLQPENKNTPPEYVKANRLLHLDYLHVQIMLYRPFIHYVKLAKEAPLHKGLKSYQYENGLKCFEVSKQIIALAKEMIQNKLLNGSYWFSVYTIFFSVACLVYYFLEIDNTNQDVKKSIEIGKQILSGLKQRSVSAERIYDLLNHMFENYDRQNIRLQEIQSQNETPQPNAVNMGHTVIETTQSRRIPQTGPFTAQQYIQTPLNAYTSPNNTPSVNTKATHTNDKLDSTPLQAEPTPKPEESYGQQTLGTLLALGPEVAQSLGMEQQDTYASGIDDIDLQLFGRFLPSYMLQKPSGMGDNHLSSESPDDFVNGSTGGSIRTDEQEFDWDRFIDKDDVLNLDFDL